MKTPAPMDPACCPLCGQPNACAMEQQRLTGEPQPPCWCTHVKFDVTLLERVEPAARGAACICAACAQTPRHRSMSERG